MKTVPAFVHRPAGPFPKSRRVVVQIQRAPDGRLLERPVAPLGWVWVEWEEAP